MGFILKVYVQAGWEQVTLRRFTKYKKDRLMSRDGIKLVVSPDTLSLPFFYPQSVIRTL